MEIKTHTKIFQLGLGNTGPGSWWRAGRPLGGCRVRYFSEDEEEEGTGKGAPLPAWMMVERCSVAKGREEVRCDKEMLVQALIPIT